MAAIFKWSAIRWAFPHYENNSYFTPNLTGHYFPRIKNLKIIYSRSGPIIHGRFTKEGREDTLLDRKLR